MGRKLGSKNKKSASKAPPTAVKVPRSDAKPKDDVFHATIKIFGKLYESTGDTVFQAIANLELEGRPRGVSVLTVRKGDKMKDVILNRLLTARLFNPSPDMRAVALKTTADRFLFL